MGNNVPMTAILIFMLMSQRNFISILFAKDVFVAASTTNPCYNKSNLRSLNNTILPICKHHQGVPVSSSRPSSSSLFSNLLPALSRPASFISASPWIARRDIFIHKKSRDLTITTASSSSSSSHINKSTSTKLQLMKSSQILPRRRRRGIIRQSQLQKSQKLMNSVFKNNSRDNDANNNNCNPPSLLWMAHSHNFGDSCKNNDHTSSAATTTTTATAITQYTINDAICPPTDPEILKATVQKHIRTLPRYWKSKPIAKHTAAAFEEALEFIKCFEGGHYNDDGDGHGDGDGGGGARTSRYNDNKGNHEKVKVILDSGCGTGRSSFVLGERYPDCVILGIDQSLARLSRNKSYQPSADASSSNKHENAPNTNNNERNNSSKNNDDNENNTTSNNKKQTSSSSSSNGKGNVLLLRAELTDFWKCCLSSPEWQQHVQIYKHYLLYPNPYPKKARFKNRFYAHPAFPLLMMTIMMVDSKNNSNTNSINESLLGGEELVVRSNWEGYLKEFGAAVRVWEDLGCGFGGWKRMLLAGDNDAEEEENDDDEWHPEKNNQAIRWEVDGPRRLRENSGVVPWTNFEAKYLECGEPVYEIAFRMTSGDKDSEK